MVNKNALERYRKIDEQLSSPQGAEIAALMELCGVSKVQLYQDFKDMESLNPHINMEKSRLGHKVVYKYAADSERLNGTKLSDQEYGNISDALKILESVKGLPYIKPAINALKKRLDSNSDALPECIAFESTNLLKNNDLVWQLYRYIRQQYPLMMTYNASYVADHTYSIQPYYLKQYNGRWFLLAWEYSRDGVEHSEETGSAHVSETDSSHASETGDGDYSSRRLMRLYAIDRMDAESVKVDRSRCSKGALRATCPVDTETYFNDVIGVTVFNDDRHPVQEIILKVHKYWYDKDGEKREYKDLDRLRTKKLHWSQEEIEETEDYVRIRIRVKKNYELYSALSQYEHIEVESPSDIRQEYVDRLQRMLQNYR